MTFAKGRTLIPGSEAYLCAACNAEERSEVEALSNRGPKSNDVIVRDDSHIQEGSADPSSDDALNALSAATAAQTQVRRTSKRRAAPVALGFALVALILAATFTTVYLVRPTWEDRELPELAKLLSLAEAAQSADQHRRAYDLYDQILRRTTGQPITRSSVRSIVDQATGGRDAMQVFVRAELEAERKAKERADAKAAEERRNQEMAAAAEAQRVAREAAERRRAEEARRAEQIAEAKRAQALAEERAKVQRLRTSEAYRSILREAADRKLELEVALVGEDSAYRAISRTSDGLVQMLALLVRREALVADRDADVTIRVSNILDRLRIDMIGEDSAIRAIDKRDAAAMELLGVYVELLDARAGGGGELSKVWRDAKSAAEVAGRGDDSAIRSIMGWCKASARVWASIAGHLKVANAEEPLERARRLAVVDDSAWRVSDYYAMSAAESLLQILEQRNPNEARTLRRSLNVAQTGEDSSLRSQYQHKLAAFKALHALVTAR